MMIYDCIESSEDAVDYQAAIDTLREEEPAIVTSLCEAIRRNDERTVRANSQQLRGGWTLVPKEEAILAENARLLRLLLKEDNLIEENIVAVACRHKNRDSIQTLLDFGWTVNQPLYLGALPLWMAVDDMEFMQWLILHGADINARSELDESTLSVAIIRGTMDVVRFLMAQETDITRGNLLHCAAQRENQSEGVHLVKALVERGADVNAHRYNNPIALTRRCLSKLPTPLHVACDERNLPVAQALLQHGADPHRKMLEALEETQPTALEVALESNDDELIYLFKATEFSFV